MNRTRMVAATRFFRLSSLVAVVYAANIVAQKTEILG